MAKTTEKRGFARPHHRGFGIVSKKPKNFKHTSRRLLTYLSSHYLSLFFVMICIIISSISVIYSGIFLGNIIDRNIIPMLSSNSDKFYLLTMQILKFMIIMILGALSTYIYSKIMLNISQEVLKTIRDEMFIHMQKLPISYFSTKGNGEIMSRFTNDIDAMVNLLTQSLPQVIANLLQMIGVFIAMSFLSWQLSIFTFLTLFIMMLILKVLGNHSSKYFSKQQKSLGTVNTYIEEMMSGIKTIKVFNHEEIIKRDFDKLNENLCLNTTKANVYSNIFMPLMQGLGYIQYALLAIFGAILGVNGYWGITLGVIVSFLQLSRSLTQPLSRLGQQVNSIVQAIAGAERVFELIDEPKEEDNGFVELVNIKYEHNQKMIACSNYTGNWAWKTKEGCYKKLKGDVVLKNLEFSYTKGKTILKNINVYAHPGQIVAFVGETGAGKTTITNLINRFYELENGEILYDGIPIKDIKKESLRKSLGMVLQDTSLFSGTIKENIRFGCLNATDEEVINAAKIANADSFITALPKGYNTFLNGEDNILSVGQRQLLSIARVAIANPPVMILDEATSSIDTRTEFYIQKAMNRLMKGKTVFVIAHRLSTIKNCDIIMVMDQGQIIERGTHKELLEKKGNYYSLYTGKKSLI